MKRIPLISLALLVVLLSLTGCKDSPEIDPNKPGGQDPPSVEVKASTEGFSSRLKFGEKADGIKLTITLKDGITFKNIKSEKDVTAWFSNLPSGVSVKAPKAVINNRLTKAVEDKPEEGDTGIIVETYGVINGAVSATFNLLGTVNEVPNEPITITIPVEYINYANVINVLFNDTTTTTVEEPKFKVTFVFDDGTDKKVEVFVAKNTSIPVAERPADPKRDDYEFNGWKDKNGAVFNLDTVITEDMTLTASWEKSIVGIPRPTISIIEEAEDTVKVKIERDESSWYCYYSTDGSNPDVNDPATKYFIDKSTTLTVIKGTIVKAVATKESEKSEVASLEIPSSSPSLYALGTETISVRVLNGNGYGIAKPERNERVALFKPNADIRREVAKGIYQDKDDIYDGLYILKVFETSDNRLLVVGNYSNSYASMKYFYYYANKGTGIEETDAQVIYDCTLGSSGDFDVKGVEIIGDTLYLVGSMKWTSIVYAYNLNTFQGELHNLGEADNVWDSCSTESSIFVTGCKIEKEGEKENKIPTVWKMDLATKKVEEISFKDYEGRTVVAGAAAETSLYLIVASFTNSVTSTSVDKILLNYDLNKKATVSSTPLNHQNGKALVIGDMTFVDGNLVIAGANASSFIPGGSDKYQYIPCVWNESGEQTILVKKGFFNSGCGAIIPHTIQKSGNDIYILSTSIYDGDTGGANYPYRSHITLGCVINVAIENKVLEFGSGWYKRCLKSEIAYFNPGK